MRLAASPRFAPISNFYKHSACRSTQSRRFVATLSGRKGVVQAFSKGSAAQRRAARILWQNAAEMRTAIKQNVVTCAGGALAHWRWQRAAS